MTLETILKERRKTYVKKLSRYSKYVFNDHFVIVMLFLFGALAFQYAEFLKTVEAPFYVGKIMVAFILAVAVFFGKLTTLVQEADQVFLALKEGEWQSHIRNSKFRSLLLPASVLLLLIGLAMPMVYVGQRLSLLDFAFIFLTALCLKWLALGLEEIKCRIGAQQRVKTLQVLLFICSVVIFLVAFFFATWAALGASILLLVLFEKSAVLKEYTLLDWNMFIQLEEKRMAKLNRLINLFTDVPITKVHAKRRKYLDPLVTKMAGEGNPFQYLFARIFWRGSSFSGLYVRLTVIGALILAVTAMPVVSVLLNILFLFATGFQLLPLYSHLNEHIMTRLYPQSLPQKVKAFEKILIQLLIGQSICFAFATLVGAGWQASLVNVVLNILFSTMFVRFYIKNRTKKRDKWAF